MLRFIPKYYTFLLLPFSTFDLTSLLFLLGTTMLYHNLLSLEYQFQEGWDLWFILHRSWPTLKAEKYLLNEFCFLVLSFVELCIH